MSSADAFISSSRIIDETNDDLLSGPDMIKAELLTHAERLGARLPPNTLDQLISELGGPEYVAEVSSTFLEFLVAKKLCGLFFALLN